MYAEQCLLLSPVAEFFDMSSVRNRDRVWIIAVPNFTQNISIAIKANVNPFIATCLPERTVFSVQAGF